MKITVIIKNCFVKACFMASNIHFILNDKEISTSESPRVRLSAENTATDGHERRMQGRGLWGVYGIGRRV